MKHKTAELEGAALDAAVAVAEGAVLHGRNWKWPDGVLMYRYPDIRGPDEYERENWWAPSTLWDQGGPIIERERIEIVPLDTWIAYTSGREHGRHGPTPLIAAMRAYVAAKLGNEIELP